MTLKRADYAHKLSIVKNREALEQAIWDADDWQQDCSGFDDEDFDAAATARAIRQRVTAAGFEFTVNPDTVDEEETDTVEA